MKLGSLFDGSGGFPLAGALCGIEPIWASEVEPYPIAVTKSRFPDMKHLGDISKINGAEIEPVDIITFGSPCQDLSVAGKRAGLKHEDNGDDETTRSGLFMEAVRIIKEMREKTNGEYPRFAVWENVPGAFSSNKGEDFRIVLEELIKIVEPSAVMPEVPRFGWAYADSYCGNRWSLAYRVLDAQYWGVPQRRRRIYLVADFGGQCAREILFEREGLRGYFTEGRTPWKTTPTYVERGIGANDREGETVSIGADPYNGELTGDKSSTLGVNCGMSSGRQSVIAFEPGAAKRLGGYAWEDVAGTLRAEMGDNQTAVAYGIDHAITTGGNCTAQGSCVYKDVQGTLKASGVHAVTYAVATQQGGAEISENGICPTITAAAGMSGNNQPWICQGLDAYNQALTGDKAKTLNSAASDADHVPCTVYSVENHPNDSRVKIDNEGKVQALTSRMGTGGGNVPMVMEPKLFEFHGQDIRLKGPLDVAPTAQAGYGEGGSTKPLVVEIIALEGNGQRPSHQGDGYAVTDKSYTLNATEKHGVVYAVDQGGGKSQANVSEDMSPTLTCTHGGEPAVCLETFHCTTEDNITQPLKARDYKDPLTVVFTDKTRYIVRRLTPTECARLQGFADRWGDIDPKTELSDAEYEFWCDVYLTKQLIDGKVFQDEDGKFYTTNGKKPFTNKNKAQMLTWYNKLPTDSAEYKMWGNGIALPTALYVIQGIAETTKGETNND